MRKLSDLFGGLSMTWRRVCVCAAVIGVYVGVVNQIPFLQDTSFRDIAVTMEWWVLFALLIVTNCDRAMEAGVKCLVFFLISQPIIFLVELPTLGLEKALYYYLRIWLPISLLTLPGGEIAYFAKRQNALGAAILGVGNTVVALVGVSYALKLGSTFPRHFLTVVSCMGIMAVTVLGIQKKWQLRLLSLAVTALLTAGILFFAVKSGRVI